MRPKNAKSAVPGYRPADTLGNWFQKDNRSLKSELIVVLSPDGHDFAKANNQLVIPGKSARAPAAQKVYNGHRLAS